MNQDVLIGNIDKCLEQLRAFSTAEIALNAAKMQLRSLSYRVEALESLLSKCPACGGAGWLWRHELPVAEDRYEQDDTRYTCPTCQGIGMVRHGESDDYTGGDV